MSQNVIEQPSQPPQVSSPNGSGFAPSSIWVAISLGMGVLGFVARGIGKGRGITQAIAKLDAIWKTVEKLPDFEEEMGAKDRRLEETILSGQKNSQDQFNDMMRLFLDMQRGLGELKDKLETYQDDIEALQQSFDEKHTDLTNKLGEVSHKTGELSLTIEKLKPFYNLIIDTLLRSFPSFIDRDEDMRIIAFALGRNPEEIRSKQQKFIQLKKEARGQIATIDQHLPAVPTDSQKPSAKQG